MLNNLTKEGSKLELVLLKAVRDHIEAGLSFPETLKVVENVRHTVTEIIIEAEEE